jgi:hypothetical protein
MGTIVISYWASDESIWIIQLLTSFLFFQPNFDREKIGESAEDFRAWKKNLKMDC